MSGSQEANIEALVMLQRCGIDIRGVDFEGRNILHHAAIAGSVTQDLSHHLGTCIGLHFFTQDKHNKTVLEYVKDMLQEEQPDNLFRSDKWRETMACFLNAVMLDSDWSCDALLT